MKTIGDRISNFDNCFEQTVKTFNTLFEEVPLTGYKENDIVTIGEITVNAVTRQILINNIAKEHCFVRRISSENDYIDLCNDSNDDSDELLYFT